MTEVDHMIGRGRAAVDGLYVSMKVIGIWEDQSNLSLKESAEKAGWLGVSGWMRMGDAPAHYLHIG